MKSDNMNPNKIAYCLDGGAYEKLWSDAIDRLSLNCVAYAENIRLAKAGVYRIGITTNGLLHREEVVAYWKNDINADDKVDVKDLVRMLKVRDDKTHADTVSALTEAGKYAIGYEDAKTWSGTAAEAATVNVRKGIVLQEQIVEDEEEDEEEVVVPSGPETELPVIPLG